MLLPVPVPVFYHGSLVHAELSSLVLARFLFEHAPGAGGASGSGGDIAGVAAVSARCVARLPLYVALAHHGAPAALARTLAAFPECAQRADALWRALDAHRAYNGATLGDIACEAAAHAHGV
jgi:hypothetical protein